MLEVNFGSNFATIIGISLVFFSFGLLIFRGRHKRYNYEFFLLPVIGLSGIILIVQSWRLDPILQIFYLILAAINIVYFLEDITRK